MSPQQPSSTEEDAAASDAAPGVGGDEPTRAELAERLERQSRLLEQYRRDLEDTQRELDDLRAELQAIRGDVDELDQRTDLLRLVEESEPLEDPQKRAGVLVEAARKKAARRGAADNDQPPRAALDKEEAEAALHLPEDAERTLAYKDMARAARLVGDDDLVAYEDGLLVVDLTAGQLPSSVGGHEVQTGNHGRE